MFNQGDGTFSKIDISDTWASKCRAIDIDNDGDWDIVQNGFPEVRVLRNDGATFSSHVISTEVLYGFEIADLDQDQYIDILAYASEQLIVYRNVSGVEFAPFVIREGMGFAQCKSGDIDGDGDIDLIVPEFGNFRALINNGNFDFTDVPIENHGPQSLSYFAYSLAIHDLDLDGDLDFFLADNYQIEVFWNTTFEEAYPFSTDKTLTNSLNHSSSAWGDYDLDGDLDLVTTGTKAGTFETIIYQNNTGSFTEIQTSIPGLAYSSIDWGDFDKDGDLDLIMSGASKLGSWDFPQDPQTLIYVNSNGQFSLHPPSNSLPKIHSGEVRWADFNNDGWLDIIINGVGYAGILSGHANGEFDEAFVIEAGEIEGNIDLKDFDLDGDLDLAVSYYDLTETGVHVYRNDDNFEFTLVQDIVEAPIGGNVLWTDIDSDGDLDLIASGKTRLKTVPYVSFTYDVILYKNESGVLSVSSHLPMSSKFYQHCVSVGDYSNDGHLDLLITQCSDQIGNALLLKNDGEGNLIHSEIELPKTETWKPEWVDFDGDNDLDIFTGKNLLVNNITTPNISPLPPTTVTLDSIRNNTIYFSWEGASDAETPEEILTYEVYVGTQTGLQDVVSSNSDLNTGFSRIVSFGKARGRNTAVRHLSGGNYFFGVKTIDSSLGSSGFTAEHPVIMFGITGSNAVCSNTNYTYHSNPSVQYEWEVLGGDLISGQGTNSIEIRWLSQGTGKIKLLDNGSIVNSLDVIIDERPTGELLGKSQVCTGSEIYQLNAEHFKYLDWEVTPNQTFTNQSNSSIFVQWDQEGPYEINAKLTTENKGCIIERTLSVDVDIKPQFELKGPSLLCSDDESVFTTNAATPIWQVTNGEVSSKSNQSITVRWEAAGPGIIALEQPSDRGYCSSFLTIPLTVRQSPPKPELRLAGITTIISTESPTGYYEWFLDNNLVAQGQYTGVYATSPGEYHVRVYSSNGCFSDSAPILFDPEIQTSVAISPNPVSDKLTLQFSDTELSEVDILIYSSMGSLVRQVSSKKTDQVLVLEIEIPELPMGQYILIIDRAGKRTSSKFVKF